MKKLVILFLLVSCSIQAQIDIKLPETINHSIQSKNLGEERNYWVSLPSNYDATLTYPVMYVLDAEWRFHLTNTLEKDLSANGKIPEHIVVGITHPNRRLDMSFSTTKVKHTGEIDTITYHSENSGNGLKFFKFIEEELIKEVKQNYATSGFNILIGHSIGGYFCSYILPFQHSFNSLQIYDPSLWYSDGEAIQHIKGNLSKETSCHIFLSSSENIENQFANHHAKIKSLDKLLNRYPNMHHTYKNYDNENHNSMYLHSFLDGIAQLYDGYELKIGDWKTKMNASSIQKHYQEFSKNIHFDFEPAIELYLTAGMHNYFQKEYQDCIESLQFYLKKDPNNLYALELMGDAYFVLGDKVKSQEYYVKAYKLSQENIRLKKKLDQF
jgi:predicted alpha/beta superfamily hydrolase